MWGVPVGKGKDIKISDWKLVLISLGAALVCSIVSHRGDRDLSVVARTAEGKQRKAADEEKKNENNDCCDRTAVSLVSVLHVGVWVALRSDNHWGQRLLIHHLSLNYLLRRAIISRFVSQKEARQGERGAHDARTAGGCGAMG